MEPFLQSDDPFSLHNAIQTCEEVGLPFLSRTNKQPRYGPQIPGEFAIVLHLSPSFRYGGGVGEAIAAWRNAMMRRQSWDFISFRSVLNLAILKTEIYLWNVGKIISCAVYL